MKAEGSGGRGALDRDGERVLAGVLSTDPQPAAKHRERCVNPRCRKQFTPRQEGDDYCCQACDLNDNPARRGKNRKGSGLWR